MIRVQLAPRALAVVAALSVVAGCTPKTEPATAVRPVKVMQVTARDAREIAAFAGEIRARHETDVAFRVGGKILERRVDLGETVKRGQILARLDPQDADLNAAAARATLAAALSDLEFARAELARYRDLLATNFVSQVVYDQKLSAFRAAEARRDAAQAQAGVSGNQAAYTSLVADVDGVVTAVSGEPGQVVTAGQAVMRIARVGEKDAIISVAENQLPLLRANPSARIMLWANPGKVYQGRVRDVAAAADVATRTYAVKVAVQDADEALRLGMSASVGFEAPGAQAILLPTTALTQTGDKAGAKAAVWVVGPDDRVAPVEVRVLRYTERGVVIGAGLKGGETVVIAGAHRLVAGQQVRPVMEDARAWWPSGATALAHADPAAVR
jgi:multidrug efflux system membrane fusion protein